LRTTGGKERIRAFDRMQNPRVSLSELEVAELHRLKTQHYSRLIGQHTCRLRPGVEPLIRGALARGQTLAIATTTTFSNVEELLSVALDSNWRSLFSVIVAGDDVARTSISRCWQGWGSPRTIVSQSRIPPTAWTRPLPRAFMC
jgi:hypothetical protein